MSNRPQEEIDNADRKWSALRESGYTGPIDHNGNAVDDMNAWIAEQLGR